MNGFIVQAVAEKVATLRARGMLTEMTVAEQTAFFAARMARSGEDRFVDILRKAGTTNEVLPGDEIPPGWLEGLDTANAQSATEPAADHPERPT